MILNDLKKIYKIEDFEPYLRNYNEIKFKGNTTSLSIVDNYKPANPVFTLEFTVYKDFNSKIEFSKYDFDCIIQQLHHLYRISEIYKQDNILPFFSYKEVQKTVEGTKAGTYVLKVEISERYIGPDYK